MALSVPPSLPQQYSADPNGLGMIKTLPANVIALLGQFGSGGEITSHRRGDSFGALPLLESLKSQPRLDRPQGGNGFGAPYSN